MSRDAQLYSAFGLTIVSDVPLVELQPGAGAPDVFVRCGRAASSPACPDAWTIEAGRGEARGWAPGAGAFLVSGGRKIRLELIPGVDDRAVRLAIVGPLLGVVLAQRGRFVLHASTVSIGGRAVAFTGPSGRGKSTLAAACARAGHAFVADDMTVIDFPGGRPMVTPGFARVKLWPDVAAAFDHDVSSLPRIHPERTKRSVTLAPAHARPLPLARCYVIEDAVAESIDRLPDGVAIVSFVALTYQSLWMHETGVSAANLRHCADLVRSGVVRRLRRRRDLGALNAVLGLVASDIGAAPAR